MAHTLNQTEKEKINTLLNCFHSEQHITCKFDVYQLVWHMRDVLKNLGVNVTILEQHEAVIAQIIEWSIARQEANMQTL